MSRYIISPHPQGTPEWHRDRCGMVTGSTCAAVFSEGRKKGSESKERLKLKANLALAIITGNVPKEGYKSPEMVWGNEQEPFARMGYEMTTGLDVSESGFVYLADGTKAGCSVDGFVRDAGKNGFTEFKSPDSHVHWGYILGGVVPNEYVPQITHNFWITGADFCDFMSYDPRMPEKLREFHKRVWRDEAAIQIHAAGVLQFLMEVDADVKKMRQLAGI